MLLLAALLTSPALAGAVQGALPVEVALTRYLVVAGVCWVLLTVAYDWLWSEPQAPVPAEAPTTTGEGVDPS
jgi:hypothetical protein